MTVSESLAVPAHSLAYLGDAVFELCVREALVRKRDLTLNELNQLAKRYVSADAQHKMYHEIYDSLSETEQAVIKRGRNLRASSRAKHAEMGAYRHATGLETLFGFLYLSAQANRLEEVFGLCAKAAEKRNADT
ncbi:MAG: ribonuclease III [Defluviitaleaceae bacterium]|nr:ribonuclease III [Defluviitaleaceae bacterium]